MNTILLNCDSDYAYTCNVSSGQTAPRVVEARSVLGTLSSRLRHIEDRLKPMGGAGVITFGVVAELTLEEELLRGLVRYYETGDVL